MKKIIFVLAHLQYSDGVAKVLCDICNALPKNEYDITVKSLYRCDKDFIKNFDSRIKVTTFLGKYFRGLDKLLEFIPQKILYKMVINDKYDVEIGFQYGLSTQIIAASTNNNASHVAWMHTYDEGLVLLDSYKKMKKVICVAKCNARRLEKESHGAVEADYCYNLVNDTKIKRLSTEECEVEETNCPLFVSVGRHSPEKGYKRLISIFDELHKEGKVFQCLLIGDGPEHEELQSLINENKLTDVVILLGAKKNPHKYTRMADAFICSSFSEGYSTACTEAAVLGIPIITTNVSGGAEIIEEAECGVLTGIDDESLKNAIRTVLDDPQLLKQWKLKAKETSVRFSMQEREQRMQELFKNL